MCETLMNEKDSPVLGLHVEGPYLNPKRAGEQFAGKLKNPDKENILLYWKVLTASSVGMLHLNFRVRWNLPAI